MFHEGVVETDEEEGKGCLSCWGRMQGQQEKDGIGMKKLPCVSEREREVCVCVFLSFFGFWRKCKL